MITSISQMEKLMLLVNLGQAQHMGDSLIPHPHWAHTTQFEDFCHRAVG